MHSKRYPAAIAVVIAAHTLVACAGNVITDDDAAPGKPPTGEAPSTTPRPGNANLVDAFDFYAQSDGRPGYLFTTPSGTWRCAIIPHDQAGCRSAKSAMSLGVKGAPQTVADSAGAQVPPNAVVVESNGDAYFTKVDAGVFVRDSGPDQTLQFGQILAAAGFRCNVQDLGISCMSETSKTGFTFSGDGFTPSYTDLPAAP
ncbi:hypothetical protein BH09ACT8_BH09ACT8_31950 [soil metagenome]